MNVSYLTLEPKVLPECVAFLVWWHKAWTPKQLVGDDNNHTASTRRLTYACMASKRYVQGCSGIGRLLRSNTNPTLFFFLLYLQTNMCWWSVQETLPCHESITY